MKVLFIVPYPRGKAPSQRFRFEQYISILEKGNIHCRIESFWSLKYWNILYHKGKRLQKAVGLILGFVRRFLLLFSSFQFDFIFIHREAAPVGPPVFEFIMAKVFQKKIIYDFDDAIWLPNVSEVNKKIGGLKWHGKVKHICRWAHKVTCGNEYLCNYARNYNKNIELIPTTIDTNYHKPFREKPTTVVIGWTGSQSTIDYLSPLIPILSQLEKKYQFEFRVISNKNPNLKTDSFRFVPWSKETEIKELQQFTIGVMPLPDDEWAKGKCGFKGLQYMSLEIPTIMSPVGVNNQIIQQGKNGFLASTEQEWIKYLSSLLSSEELRQQIGKEGRKTVEEKYSVNALSAKYVELFS